MQYNLLDAYNVDRLITKKEMLNLIEALNKIDKAMDLKELLGIEGRFAKLYFAIEKCRIMQLKMQRFATQLVPF